MLILLYDLLPHILYNKNEKPKAATTSAICDVVISIAKTVLNLYPSREWLYQVNEIEPTKSQ